MVERPILENMTGGDQKGMKLEPDNKYKGKQKNWTSIIGEAGSSANNFMDKKAFHKRGSLVRRPNKRMSCSRRASWKE